MDPQNQNQNQNQNNRGGGQGPGGNGPHRQSLFLLMMALMVTMFFILEERIVTHRR